MTFANSELADSDVHDRFVAGSSILDSLDSIYGFGVLFTLAAAGIVLVNERKRLVILVMMIAALTATMSLFSSARYRMVIVPMMIPLAAGAIEQIVRWWRFVAATPAHLQRAKRGQTRRVRHGITRQSRVVAGARDRVARCLRTRRFRSRSAEPTPTTVPNILPIVAGWMMQIRSIAKRSTRIPSWQRRTTIWGFCWQTAGIWRRRIHSSQKRSAWSHADPSAQIKYWHGPGSANDLANAVEHFRSALRFGSNQHRSAIQPGGGIDDAGKKRNRD